MIRALMTFPNLEKRRNKASLVMVLGMWKTNRLHPSGPAPPNESNTQNMSHPTRGNAQAPPKRVEQSKSMHGHISYVARENDRSRASEKRCLSMWMLVGSFGAVTYVDDAYLLLAYNVHVYACRWEVESGKQGNESTPYRQRTQDRWEGHGQVRGSCRPLVVYDRTSHDIHV